MSFWGEVQRHAYNTAMNATSAAIATKEAADQFKANATAVAIANASPIAYPPTNTSLALDDPLQDNSKGNRWKIDDPGKGNCRFINRACQGK